MSLMKFDYRIPVKRENVSSSLRRCHLEKQDRCDVSIDEVSTLSFYF